jgi:hypothetical protein
MGIEKGPSGADEPTRGRCLWAVSHQNLVSEVQNREVFQPPYRCFTRIGGPPLYQKQLGVFLHIFNILRNKGEINFKIGGIG